MREVVPSGSASDPECEDEQHIQSEQNTHSESQGEHEVDVDQMSNTNSTRSASSGKPDSGIREEARDERKRSNTEYHNAAAEKELPPSPSNSIEAIVEEG